MGIKEQIEEIIEQQLKQDSTQSKTYDKILDLVDCLVENNEELKEQVNLYKSHVHNYYQQIQNYRNNLYEIDVKRLMSKKLTPEQKEIYYKGFCNCERQISLNIADVQIETRKQVCNELREKVSVSSGMISSYEELLNFRKILDQIEQTKENIRNE